MKTNVLFLVNYNQADYMCPSINYSLGYSKSQPHIISFFENQINKQIYANYFNLDKNLRFHHNNENLKQVLSTYLVKYEWFVLLSPESLYHDGYAEEIGDLCTKNNSLQSFVIQHKTNDKDTYSIIISRSLFQNYLSKELNINDIEKLYLNQNNLIQKVSFKATPLKNVVNNPSISFEDRNCIFAKFCSSNSYGLVDSYIYINKTNNRIYNIDNNIIGILQERQGDKITIEWQLTSGAKQILHYVYNNVLKIYINI